jgi:hypothetical protein
MLWINRAQPNAWAITDINLSQSVFPMARLSRRRLRFQWLPRMRPEGMTKVQLVARLVLHSEGYK